MKTLFRFRTRAGFSALLAIIAIGSSPLYANDAGLVPEPVLKEHVAIKATPTTTDYVIVSYDFEQRYVGEIITAHWKVAGIEPRQGLVGSVSASGMSDARSCVKCRGGDCIAIRILVKNKVNYGRPKIDTVPAPHQRQNMGRRTVLNC